MRVVATTVVREAVRGKQSSGYIYDVDWTQGRVARRLPVPEPSFPQSDDNPRGGVRGGRGVAPTRHGIAVANYDTLYLYDDDWNVVDEVSHPLFIGMHEIDWDGAHVWTSSTRIDALVKVALDGHAELAWDPHASAFSERFGLAARPDAMDGSVDYRVGGNRIDECHLNGVVCRNGSIIVNCGLVQTTVQKQTSFRRRVVRQLRRSLRRNRAPQQRYRTAVVRVQGPTAEEILLDRRHGRFPTHNGQLLDDGRVAVNDSAHNVLRIYSVQDGREVQAIDVPGTWLRGLEPLDAERVLVGTAPGAISLVDLRSGTVAKTVQLSEDPREAVHGLALCPPISERL